MLSHSELIDTDGECSSNIPAYPLQVSFATGVYINDKIVICSGFTNFNDIVFPQVTKECYQLEKGADAFELVYNMENERLFGRSIMIQGNMLVSGGIDFKNNVPYSGTGEYINHQIGNDTAPRPKIQLPEPIESHSFININSSISIMAGGVRTTTWVSNKTHFYNSDTHEWKRGPDLSQGRLYHASGVLIDHATGNKHVAVVGGIGRGTETKFVALNSVELLLHGENSWTQGKSEKNYKNN